ncbi:hypothetical protein NPIL_101321 [Nephila pilipes]|uniref:Uncharacterized protein n=1 Tax=Nephila pilipes TaxID=299642 RepID=A0A8X6NR23_NEPPI|nr:hypothetical protein NPIL_101321 [Nephila pilipes]
MSTWFKCFFIQGQKVNPLPSLSIFSFLTPQLNVESEHVHERTTNANEPQTNLQKERPNQTEANTLGRTPLTRYRFFYYTFELIFSVSYHVSLILFPNSDYFSRSVERKVCCKYLVFSFFWFLK